MKKKTESHRCGRCETACPSLNALRKHSKRHTETLAEIRLLQQGHLPEETKHGNAFRGKNRVIIS